MLIILELKPEVEARLRIQAARSGQPLESLLQTWIEEKADAASPFPDLPPLPGPPGEPIVFKLMRLSPKERGPYLAAGAAAAAPEHEADLALPVAQRELTAFSSFGEPFYEYRNEN